MNRFVLCRPQAGFNDMLCQIEKCCRYAEQTDRTIIVDTNYKNSPYFQDDLRRYFVSRQSRFILSADEFRQSFDRWDVFPECLSGRVNEYEAACSPDWIRRDTKTGTPLTFDFSKDYPHQLLVHHQGGGGNDSMFALLRMKTTETIADELLKRVRAIGSPYVGIHVRHTDYQSRYEQTLSELKHSPVGPLFLATDNRAVLNDFRSALGDDSVFSFAELPVEAGVPMHTLQLAGAEAFRRNLDSIVDLFMLALANKLMLLKVSGLEGGGYSGFSRLAYSLWSSKMVLRHVVSTPEIKIGLD